MQMSDSDGFLVNYRKYIDVWNELTGGEKGSSVMEFDVSETEIGGQKALQLTMNLAQFMTLQTGNDEAAAVLEPMIEKLFGPDGTMKITLVTTDKTTVASGIGSDEQIKRAVELMRSGAAGLDAAQTIGKTARLLPEAAGLACFVSPRGVVAWADRLVQIFAPAGMAPTIPPMPESPPVGFATRLAPAQLETETVVPAETLETIGSYIEQLRQ
jgi:hypothetical protein